MRKILLLTLAATGLLTGCAEKPPKLFGVPYSSYTGATQTQRQNIIQNYNTHIRKHYKTEPKITISPVPPALMKKQTKKPAKTQQDKPSTSTPPKPQPPQKDTSWLQLNQT